MKTLYKSLALGVALAALASGAVASAKLEAPTEAGCSASAFAEAAAPLPSPSALNAPDGSRYWRTEVLRIGSAGSNLNAGTDGQGPVRLEQAVGISREASRVGSVTLERISSKVERLGQGLADTALVNNLMSDTTGRRESAGEHQLPMLLLAAAAVVAFVARRRRFN